jgi:hypothetical protein
MVIFLATLWLVACTGDDEDSSSADATLEPSQIAADLRVTPDFTATSTRPAPEPVQLSPRQTALPIRTAVTPTLARTQVAAAQVITTTPTIPTVVATTTPSATVAPSPTSNHDEIVKLVENPNLLLKMEVDTVCFLAEDFIPFRLTVTSFETQPIYFYKEGRWMLSINNSPVGPQLTSREPTLRDEFVEIPPNQSYATEYEDLGLWVLSLGPDSGIPFTTTGLGLPMGDYWVTFVYNNDQDGLSEQVDGTYLLDRPAWRGTAVAQEVRFRVVNDLAEC